MRKNIFKQKIPTILGLLILFIGAGAGVILVGDGVDFLPRAGPEYTPRNLQITNVTDRSFSVSWVTDSATVGFLDYGATTSLGTTITDDRDQLSGDVGLFRVHQVTVRGLSANTTYYFKVGSGPNSDLYDNQGSPYQVTTGASLGAPAESETMYGKVVTQANTPAEGALVYVKLDGAAPLSTLVKSSGSWAVSLSSLRTQDLNNYYAYDSEAEIISLEIVGLDGSLTSGQTNTANDQPVPTITLAQNFDFTNGEDVAASTQPQPTTTPAADETPKRDDNQNPVESRFNVDSFDESAELPSQVDLINPSYDGETINTTRPEIQGRAPANAEVTITVESDPVFEDAVTSDAQGRFTWSPPADLEPGEHTITVSWLDDNGVRQFLQRNFVVQAQGDLPAFTSTPSATPVADPSPTPSPTLVPSPSPVVSPSPSPRTVPSPLPSPSPRVTQPSTDSAVPKAGSTTQTYLMLFGGLLLIGLGGGLAYKLD